MGVHTERMSIENGKTVRERFIPVSRQQIVADLLAERTLTDEDQGLFSRFSTILSALYHFRFHQTLDDLKRTYYVFSPDSDVIGTATPVTDGRTRDDLEDEFLTQFDILLNNANYERISDESLDAALAADSPWGLNVEVDRSDYDILLLYSRGTRDIVEQRRSVGSLGMKREQVTPTYKRLAVVLKLRGEPHIYLKLFKDMPRSGLETVLPKTRLRMRGFDKIKLGSSIGVGLGVTLWKVLSLILFTAVTSFGILIVAAAAITYAVRAFFGYKNIQRDYLMKLSQNLFFQNLDNNAGVFHHIVDLAEEEETKEALLAYYFLHAEKNTPYIEDTLDERVERWIKERYGIEMDYEVSDGIAKLRRQGLLYEDKSGRLKVVPLMEACTRLDEEWDNYFQFNGNVHTSESR